MKNDPPKVARWVQNERPKRRKNFRVQPSKGRRWKDINFQRDQLFESSDFQKGRPLFAKEKQSVFFCATPIQGIYNIVLFLKTPHDDGYSDVLKHNKRVRLILLKGGL